MLLRFILCDGNVSAVDQVILSSYIPKIGEEIAIEDFEDLNDKYKELIQKYPCKTGEPEVYKIKHRYDVNDYKAELYAEIHIKHNLRQYDND